MVQASRLRSQKVVYFLVNNDFHVYDVKLLASEIGYDKCSLISVPYRMEVPRDLPFARQYTFERCQFLEKQAPSKIRKLIDIHRDNFLKRRQLDQLKISKDDVLFVFTECELMNMFCIDKFYRKGCKVYLIEDGIASYIYYNSPSTAIPKRWKVLKYLYGFLYGLKGFNPYHAGDYLYAMLSDAYFRGVCLFTDYSISRDIPVVYLHKNEPEIVGLDKNKVILLTQPLYQTLMDEREHIATYERILRVMSGSFSNVYVKPHPSEFADHFADHYQSIAQGLDNVMMLNSNDVVENCISQHGVGVAVALFSSALGKLAYKGIEPIYFYHLIEQQKQQHSDIDTYLKQLNYNFIKSFDDITPDYSSGILAKMNKGRRIGDLVESNV